MKSETSLRHEEGYGRLFALLLLVLIAWVIGGWLVHSLNEGTDRGQFGDMFGAVNALFSGFAFAALIFTIRQQSKELSLQREELQLTRNELSGQREQMASQASTLKLQQFENTFFQLLRVHGDIVNAIDLTSDGRQHATKGRDCFAVFYKRLKNTDADGRFQSATEVEHLHEMYERFYRGAQAEIGHYFRHLYHIIKFVDTSEIHGKRRYTSFVRAQLSSHEIQLLFYNCLSEYGKENFKPLVERYGLLKHLPKDAPRMHRRRYFDPRAFLPAEPRKEDLDAIGAADATTWESSNGLAGAE